MSPLPPSITPSSTVDCERLIAFRNRRFYHRQGRWMLFRGAWRIILASWSGFLRFP